MLRNSQTRCVIHVFTYAFLGTICLPRYDALAGTTSTIHAFNANITAGQPIGAPCDYVAWWRFEGNLADEVGSSEGVFHGDAQIIEEAEKGNVLSLDGDNDYVEIAHVPSLDTGPDITLSAWVKLNCIPPDGSTIVVKLMQDTNDPSVLYALDMSSEQAFRFLLFDSDSQDARLWHSTSIVCPRQNTWHHLVGAYGRDKMRLYLDAVLVHTKSVDSVLGTSQMPVWIGGYPEGMTLDGYVDDIMIYRRLLTPREIEQLYETQAPQRPDSVARVLQDCVLAGVRVAIPEDALVIQNMICEAELEGSVHLPEGCYEVAGIIDIPEGLDVLGAGLGKTILYRNGMRSHNSSDPILRVIGTHRPKSTRISGMTLLGMPSDDDRGWDRGIWIEDCTDFRIDSCYFQGFGDAAIKVSGDSCGVVDRCLFVDNYKPAIGNVGYGVSVYGMEQQDNVLELGTANGTYVEDCTIVGSRHAIAANRGAHYVFRHNLVEENVISSAVDAHGPGYGSERGTRCIEVYYNVIRNPTSGGDLGMLIRGGSGVIFSNVVEGYRMPIGLVLEFGTPEELRGDYPWLDQVHDLWIWDNLDGDKSTVPEVQSYDRSLEFIELGRDYFVEPRPSYEPFEYPHPLRGYGQ